MAAQGDETGAYATKNAVRHTWAPAPPAAQDKVRGL
jgi:hypothetical protein